MFTVALILIAKIWKQPRCPSIGLSPMLSPEYHKKNNPIPKGQKQTLIISSHSPKWYILKVGLHSLSVDNRTVTLHISTPTSQPQNK